MTEHAMTIRSGDGRAGSEAHLWVCSGKNVGRRYKISAGPEVLGRALDCDIVVEDERASQRHCRVRATEGGHFVEDMGSTNGTYVNSQRIREATLRDGDLLQVGETIFEYLSSEDRTAVRGVGAEGTAPAAAPAHALRQVRRDQVEMVPPAPAYPAPPAPYGGHPHYPAHYAGYYEEPEPEEKEEAKKGPNLIEIILRVKQVVGLYVPYWPMFVAFIFVGVMLGAVHFKLLPPGKTAVFQVIFRTTGTSANTLSEGFDNQNGLSYFGDQVVKRFTAAPIVERALTKLNGKAPSEEDIAEIQGSLEFSKDGTFQSHQYSGLLKGQKPDFAVRYLNAHLAMFIDREIEMGVSPVKADVEFFGQEVEKAAKQLEQAEAALTKYKSEHPEALQVKSNYSDLAGYERELQKLKTTAAGLEEALRVNRRELRRTPRLATSGLARNNPYQAQIATANSKIAAARAAGKGDQHPDIVALKAELEELKQLSRDPKLTAPNAQMSLNQNYQRLESQIHGDQATLQSTRRQIAEIEKLLEKERGDIAKLPEAEAKLLELSGDFERAEREHDLLLKKLKNAELQLERERVRADSQYQVLVEPRLEHKPAGKVRMIRLAVGGFGGFALSFAIASLILLRSGRLTLSMILGREIDLSALTGSAPSGGPALGDGSSAAAQLGPGGDDAVPNPRAPTAALPPSSGSAARAPDATDVLPHRKP